MVVSSKISREFLDLASGGVAIYLDSQIIVTLSLCSAAILAAVCLAGRMPALLLKRNYIRRGSVVRQARGRSTRSAGQSPAETDWSSFREPQALGYERRLS